MKFLTAMFATVAAHHAAAEPLDLDRMLWSIQQVENTPYWKQGKAGERSVYQITPAVWVQHSSQPFYWASSDRVVCRAEVRRVALAHLNYISDELAKWDLPNRPYYVALAYSAGMSAVINGTASRAKTNYATKAHNLYFAQ